MLRKKELFTIGICASTITLGIVSSLYYYKASNKVLKIIESSSPKLLQTSTPIDRIDNSVISLSNRMISTLRYHTVKDFSKGILPCGLTAPQVGIAKRLIVCGIGGEIKVLINPEILTRRGTYMSQEGCLSVNNGKIRTVKRSGYVKIQYSDLDNRQRTLEARNRYAALLEHEIDHLNGVVKTEH